MAEEKTFGTLSVSEFTAAQRAELFETDRRRRQSMLRSRQIVSQSFAAAVASMEKVRQSLTSMRRVTMRVVELRRRRVILRTPRSSRRVVRRRIVSVRTVRVARDPDHPEPPPGKRNPGWRAGAPTSIAEAGGVNADLALVHILYEQTVLRRAAVLR
jgi:hypothetical protein